MTPRVVITLLLTGICWFAISLLSLGGRVDRLWHHLAQAVRFDEEFMVFSCFLLLSVGVAVHVVAVGWRTSYRHRFLFPELGILYSVAALILGTVARQPMRNPVEAWFQVIYPLLVICGFVAIFGRRYVRILRHEPDA